MPPVFLAFFIVLFLAALTASFYNWRLQPTLISPRAISQEQVKATPIQKPPLANLEKPVDSTRSGTRDLAYQALFSQWGILVNSKTENTL